MFGQVRLSIKLGRPRVLHYEFPLAELRGFMPCRGSPKQKCVKASASRGPLPNPQFWENQSAGGSTYATWQGSLMLRRFGQHPPFPHVSSIR
jgi:hypothetical protein